MSLAFDMPESSMSLSEFAYSLSAVEDEGPSKEVRELGAAAGAILGVFVIPTLLRNMRRGGPVGTGTILAGGVIGAVLGYWRPLPMTLIQGSLLLTEL